MKNQTKTIHFILGAPLTGKSHLINEKYDDTDKYYVINYANTFYDLFGNYEDFEEENKLLKVYNAIAQELHENFHFDKKELIIEFCTGFAEHDELLKELIHLAKNTSAEVKVTALEKPLLESKQLQSLAKEDEKYYSSYYLNEHHHELLSNFFEDMQLTKSL